MEGNNNKRDKCFLNNLIYVKDDVLSNVQCENMINYIESSSQINKTSITTRSYNNFYSMPINKQQLCNNYGNELKLIIKNSLNEYLDSSPVVSQYFELYSDIIRYCDDFHLFKYEQNNGKFEYHDDFRIEENKYRILTFLWYLNDVDVGGETEFFDEIKIKPKQGRLLVFPCAWPYIHRGNIPQSSNKYIITGWVYVENPF